MNEVRFRCSLPGNSLAEGDLDVSVWTVDSDGLPVRQVGVLSGENPGGRFRLVFIGPPNPPPARPSI